jgi:cytochrome c peroxidase
MGSGIPIEEGVYAAQDADLLAGPLTENGAAGGPIALSDAIAAVVAASRDGPVDNPLGTNFNPKIFSLYDSWAFLTGADPQSDARRKIARGQEVFNTVQFNISGVPGLNDFAGQTNIRGSCGTCHNTPNVGNNSLGLTMNIGVTAPNPPALDTGDLPVFNVACNDKTVKVTDLGVAMVSGLCDDIGKTKVPVLRALPGRSPYFHNGAATEITDLISFYNERFSIGLSKDQIGDLAAFLESL